MTVDALSIPQGGVSHHALRSSEAYITDEELESSIVVPSYDLHVTPYYASATPAEGRLFWSVPGASGAEDPSAKETLALAYKGAFIHSHHKYPVKRLSPPVQFVNGTGKTIFLAINGERSGHEVYEHVIANLRQPYGVFKDSTYEFIKQMVRHRQAYLSPTPVPATVAVTGSEEYTIPQHLSIEVTANCNIECIHCYGTFEQTRFDAISATDLLELLRELKKKGLSVVELTGGECTTHPEFARILRWCVENLSGVAVLTNAVSLKEEHFEIMEAYANKLLVQICINGSEEYHDKFTKARHSYRKAMRAMERVARAGAMIRSPMNVTWENYLQIEQTCADVLSNGATYFMTNWVNHGYGRAQEESSIKGQPLPLECHKLIADRVPESPHDGPCEHLEAGLTCLQRAEIREWWGATMTKLQVTYGPVAVIFEMSDDSQRMMKWEGSCGAGRRSLYIASNGRVGICPMSVESGIPGFGTLSAEGSIETIVNSEFAKHFGTIPAPNHEDCDGCPHELEHRHCLLHGIKQFMKTPDTCKWGQKHNVQKLIDVGFHTLAKNPDGSYDVPELQHCGSGCGSAARSEGPSLVQIGLINR
jgi:MoaA/NifB/PqqE/SkfB family radical SAM enzyme